MVQCCNVAKRARALVGGHEKRGTVGAAHNDPSNEVINWISSNTVCLLW